MNKLYKRYRVEAHIGELSSIIARNTNKAEIINFAMDAHIKIWLVTDKNLIPNHYAKTAEFDDFCKIYDDSEAILDITAKTTTIYTAGDLGCLIHIEELKRLSKFNGETWVNCELEEFEQ